MTLRYASHTAAIVVICAAVAVSQPKSTLHAIFPAGADSVTIPLDIDNNIIRMKVRINGSRELTMIFDTGASLTSIDGRLVKELGLRTTKDKLNGHGTGGNFTGSYVKSSTISVAGVKVTDQPLAAFKMNVPPGFEFDGIIGYDFIRAFVVDLDYDAKSLKLSDPNYYVYHGRGEVIPLDLRGRKTPLVMATFRFIDHPPVVSRLEVDSGFDGAFQLNTPVVKKQSLVKLFKNGKNAVSHGAGGDQQDLNVRVESVHFGRVSIKNPAVALSLATTGAGAATDSDGLIGGEVLRRFKIVIDYSRKRLIIEKNTHFNDPFELEGGE